MLRHDCARQHHDVDIYFYLEGIGLDLRVDQRLLPVQKYRQMKEVQVTLE